MEKKRYIQFDVKGTEVFESVYVPFDNAKESDLDEINVKSMISAVRQVMPISKKAIIENPKIKDLIPVELEEKRLSLLDSYH